MTDGLNKRMQLNKCNYQKLFKKKNINLQPLTQISTEDTY